MQDKWFKTILSKINALRNSDEESGRGDFIKFKNLKES